MKTALSVNGPPSSESDVMALRLCRDARPTPSRSDAEKSIPGSDALVEHWTQCRLRTCRDARMPPAGSILRSTVNSQPSSELDVMARRFCRDAIPTASGSEAALQEAKKAPVCCRRPVKRRESSPPVKALPSPVPLRGASLSFKLRPVTASSGNIVTFILLAIIRTSTDKRVRDNRKDRHRH